VEAVVVGRVSDSIGWGLPLNKAYSAIAIKGIPAPTANHGKCRLPIRGFPCGL
jgi:hypothetical protein